MAEIVLVASGGGHLEQLRYLADRLPTEHDRRWITFKSQQSQSLLRGEEDVMYVPYVGPRDYVGLARNLKWAGTVGTKADTAAVISTGAGLALAYLPLSAARGIPTHYIESATRVLGPSLTGRFLARTPGVQVHTQYRGWATQKWTFSGSVFEGFEAVDGTTGGAKKQVRKVVVSLGTIRPYGFRRLIERLVSVLDDDVEVTWQTGSTNVDGLPISARPEIPHHELYQEIQAADVLVAHAGTGIALTAFRAGVRPLLVPRESAHHEHVDDHQKQIAKLLGDAGLAISRAVDDLTRQDIELASSKVIVPGSAASSLPLSLN